MIRIYPMKSNTTLNTFIIVFAALIVIAAVVFGIARSGSNKATTRTETTLKDKETTPIDTSFFTGFINGHEWVDLGLSVKWATCNVGASSPKECGDYYAWGETEPNKYSYTWAKYKYYVSGDSLYNIQFSRYNTDGSFGNVDGKVVLSLKDDVANVKWKGSWRMPTKEECGELVDECDWSWDHNGYKITGPNGMSIFLPAAGYRDGSSTKEVDSDGHYWSSSLHTDRPSYAWFLFFPLSDHGMGLGLRRFGLPVRPVAE